MITKTSSITSDIPSDNIKFEIYAFSKIISSFFNLKPYQEDEMIHIFKNTWKYRVLLYNRIKYENVLLGICKYIMLYDEQFNIYDILPNLYSDETIIYNSNQVYIVFQMLLDVLND